MEKQTEYVIQCINSQGSLSYIQIDYDNLNITFGLKSVASRFQSINLTNGWLFKAQAMFPVFRFSVVQL